MRNLSHRLALAGTGLAVAGSLALGLAGPSVAGASPASVPTTAPGPGAKAPATLESIKSAVDELSKSKRPRLWPADSGVWTGVVIGSLIGFFIFPLLILSWPAFAFVRRYW